MVYYLRTVKTLKSLELSLGQGGGTSERNRPSQRRHFTFSGNKTLPVMSESQPKQEVDKYPRRTLSAVPHGRKLQSCGHVTIRGLKAIFREEFPSDFGYTGEAL